MYPADKYNGVRSLEMLRSKISAADRPAFDWCYILLELFAKDHDFEAAFVMDRVDVCIRFAILDEDNLLKLHWPERPRVNGVISLEMIRQLDMDA